MSEPETIAAAFGVVMHQARVNAGMSQEELAHRAGLDRSTISQVERGNSAPRIETLIRVAGALGVEPCSLLPSVRWTPPAETPEPSGSFDFQGRDFAP